MPKSTDLSRVELRRRQSLPTVSVLMAVFPGEPGLAGFIGNNGDKWSYKTCKAPVKSSPPTNQHPKHFNSPDALPIAQPTVS